MSNEHTQNWPDLAIGLYDRLTGSNAEITYEFEDMNVMIPSGTGENAKHAKWQFNGILKIRTSDTSQSPN